MQGSTAMKLFCACVAISLLYARGGQAQRLFPRIERSRAYALYDTSPVPGSTFYVPLGQMVQLYCICESYTILQVLHNDRVLHPWQSCNTLLLTMDNVSYSDQGRYTCRVQDAANYTCDRPLGNLSVINEDVVIAESQQYGVVNMSTSLNCSSTLDVLKYTIIYEWFRGHGESKVPLGGRPEFERTSLSDKGYYTCQVYISSMDIKIEKIVEFLVIEPPPTTETPPTSETPPSLTVPTISKNGIIQIEATPSGIRDILKPLSAFWLLIIIAVLLLGT